MITVGLLAARFARLGRDFIFVAFSYPIAKEWAVRFYRGGHRLIRVVTPWRTGRRG
jgi:hypothetical protein